MEGIIVGVDESPHAAQALRWAVDRGTRFDEPVTAVLAWGYLDQHHVEPHRPFDPNYGESDACAALDGIVRGAVDAEAHVARRTVCDLPARALLDAATDASLVVVGARGVGGFEGLMMGSVSRHVLHHAACPVVVVRSVAHTPRLDHHTADRIVVGVDGSLHARRALHWAVEEARIRQVPLVAVNAWHYSYIGATFYAPIIDIDVAEKSAAAALDAEVDAVDTTGLIAPIRHALVFSTSAATALLDIVDEQSMLVVGRRGLGGFAGLLLGSVSDQVASHAPCPVAVIPSLRR
jgi:nucleotide-binding universal stress UspA family protein